MKDYLAVFYNNKIKPVSDYPEKFVEYNVKRFDLVNKNQDFKSLIKERNLPVTIFEELPDIDLRSKKRNMIGELSPDPATDFPTIASVNMSNPYMEQTPEKLGFKDIIYS